MKKILCCILSVVMLLFSFTACELPFGGNNNSETNQESIIEFKQNEFNLVVGESVQAEVVTAQKNVFIFWSMRDEGIASVDNKGVITAISAGETVCYAEFGGQTAMCLVRVSKKPAAQEIAVVVPYQNNQVSLYNGGSLALNAYVQTGETVLTDIVLDYAVEDETVVSVADGKLIANAIGETTVTISAVYNNQTVSTVVYVQVFDMPKEVKSFTISGYTTEYTIGDKVVFDGVVDVEFTDGTTQSNIDYYTVDISNYNATKIGTYEIVVMVGDIQQSYSVTVVKGKSLKLLMIGNSFSQDTVNWLPGLAKSVGFTDIIIGNLVIGGCTIATHYANSQSNATAYEFTYYQNNAWTNASGRTMESGIKHTTWDYICLQQQSGASGNPSTYNKDLDGLVEYVKDKALKDDVKLVWNMTWAYPDKSTWFGGLYLNDQMNMYNSICSTVQSKILTNPEFCLISPAGTAVQNARTSFFGNSYIDNQDALDTLNRDGAHLSQYEGRFISSLSMFCTLTGYMPNEIDYCPSNVDEKELAVIKECVTNALNNPYQVTNSQYTTK